MEARKSGAGIRLLRVEKEIRQTIAGYLIGGFRGDLKGLVTVSRVGVSADLRTARVFVSVLGDAAEQKTSLSSLQERARDVQAEVDRQLRMKHCPRLSFELDPGLEKSMRMESIFRSIEQERKARAADLSPDEFADTGGACTP